MTVGPESSGASAYPVDGEQDQDITCAPLPYPTVLVGEGTALWDSLHYDVCPGCGGRELKPHEYCLRCDRWGLDYLVTPTRRMCTNVYGQRRAKLSHGIRLTNREQRLK